MKPEKGKGAKGTRQLARMLNSIAAFEKDKNEEEYISTESLNTEIIMIRKRLLDEQKEDGKKR